MESAMKEVLAGINRYQPTPWHLIPDLGLYMDQVITFITRMYEPLYGDASANYISASMINNYVKAKLIPRPEGKKYNREQIALLAMIVALKQVSSMEDIRIMLTLKNGMTVQQLYTLFCERQQAVIGSLSSTIDESLECDLSPAMNYAIVASGYRIACESMLKADAPIKA